ncbi:MAG: oxygen-dependent protoporphyrinogen oxidase [Glaciecola sp.]|jgi:oxygen-dependent protoporphyrinogen oxidase
MAGPKVTIVGGGLSGLATAWFLHQAQPQLDVVVRESSARLGGKIFSPDLAGQPFDVGADSFLFRQPEFAQLCTSLGLGDDLVAPETGQVWLWIDGQLRALPGGTVMGLPGNLDLVEASGVLSGDGLARARAEVGMGTPTLGPDDDPNVASFVQERFGTEVLERLVDPLLSGIYAGDTRRLGLRSAAPAIAAVADAAVQKQCSLTEVMELRAQLAQTDSRPVFKTVRGGLHRVISAMAVSLQVRLESPVQTLSQVGGAWQVDGEQTDAVVLATPAFVSAQIASSAAPALASLLERIQFAGAAVISFAFPAGTELPQGSGMLVPRDQDRLLKAVTWSSRKWPHLAERDEVLLRCSTGRVSDARHELLSDEELQGKALAEIREAMGVQGMPVAANVARWPRALAQYDTGHRGRVAEIMDAADERGLVLTGASYDGVGLPSCVRQARVAAEKVLAQFA